MARLDEGLFDSEFTADFDAGADCFAAGLCAAARREEIARMQTNFTPKRRRFSKMKEARRRLGRSRLEGPECLTLQGWGLPPL